MLAQDRPVGPTTSHPKGRINGRSRMYQWMTPRHLPPGVLSAMALSIGYQLRSSGNSLRAAGMISALTPGENNGSTVRRTSALNHRKPWDLIPQDHRRKVWSI